MSSFLGFFLCFPEFLLRQDVLHHAIGTAWVGLVTLEPDFVAIGDFDAPWSHTHGVEYIRGVRILGMVGPSPSAMVA